MSFVNVEIADQFKETSESAFECRRSEWKCDGSRLDVVVALSLIVLNGWFALRANAEVDLRRLSNWGR